MLILLVVVLFFTGAASCSAHQLFSDGFTSTDGVAVWAARFGAFRGDNKTLWPSASVAADGESEHAEAQRIQFVGTDFEYSADVTLPLPVDRNLRPVKADAHLQFRISDEGRYGVRLQLNSITIYQLRRAPYLDLDPPRPCSTTVPTAITHCPEWAEKAVKGHPNWDPLDGPSYRELVRCEVALAPRTPHRVVVNVDGSRLVAVVDGQHRCSVEAPSPVLMLGRFGVYAYGSPLALREIAFSNVRATTDLAAIGNFSLLYSTAGYDARSVKRALVRTLNNVADSMVNPTNTTFALKHADGTVAKSGGLRRLPQTTFGMQLWEIDFTDVSTPGRYELDVFVGVPGRRLHLTSGQFRIEPRLLSKHILKPLSIENAEARRGADEDFRRSWIRESGAWEVGVDGAFIADRADDGAGATLKRVFNINNEGLEGGAGDFRFVGRATIVSGCDAQMRFQDTARDWWAVTLQAGDGGGCLHGSGPGAIRISVEGPWGFRPLASQLFPVDHPVKSGQPHDIEILVIGDTVKVFVDRTQGATERPFLTYSPVAKRLGPFGLKALAATVRFEDVQAWDASVKFRELPSGSVRIPVFKNWTSRDHTDFIWVPCQYTPPVQCPQDLCRSPVDSVEVNGVVTFPEESHACNPIFGQLHGFHDSSSMVAEGTSHGSFLSGLMQVWRRRAHGFTQAERERLRRAILTNVLYLENLYREGGDSGQFAHSEMGRVEVQFNDVAHTTYGLYGLSDFASDGELLEPALARIACEQSILAARWLWPDENAIDPILGSVVFSRLARCAARERFPFQPFRAQYADLALTAADRVINSFGDPETVARMERHLGRITPWFEGVYEVWQAQPTRTTTFRARLLPVADQLVRHLLQYHRCRLAICPPNGFQVVPQGTGQGDIPRRNWVDMTRVPTSGAFSSKVLPFVTWYNVQGHFPTAVVDSLLLARITGDRRLEPLAAGNLYWPLGLNPGVPASKVVNGVRDGTRWQASAFLYRLEAPFARAQQGFRVESYSSKGWLEFWEDRFDHPHREAWRIDPQNRSFLTFVNGHVLWDEQWDYWNSGGAGWLSGETFILGDGAFLKAAILFEDYLSNVPDRVHNPYDTKRPALFDTTHVDRAGLPWSFDDPERTISAQASRMVTDFCNAKGFLGGRPTGHFIGERVGAVCTPTTGAFFDLTDEDVASTGWDFTDINLAPWAQVARAATDYCASRGFAGGFFTGHQLNHRRGVVCVGWDAAVGGVDAADQELTTSGYGFADINTVPWAQAARAATNICVQRGFTTGFFTGHQVPGRRGVVCVLP